MLYLIGLGLNVDGISSYGLAVARKCKNVYLENYTVDFPYSTEELKEILGKKIIPADRNLVEGLSLIDEAKKQDICLLVYGSPLTATTHISLIDEAKKSGIKVKVIYNASILDAVAETGLQIYKFGKIASISKEKAESFFDVIEGNKKIGAHSLILIDIGMNSKEALEFLEETAKKRKFKLNKIVLCQALGTRKSKVWYDKIEELKELEVENPFCIIIPGKMHFLEKEFLDGLK